MKANLCNVCNGTGSVLYRTVSAVRCEPCETCDATGYEIPGTWDISDEEQAEAETLIDSFLKEHG